MEYESSMHSSIESEIGDMLYYNSNKRTIWDRLYTWVNGRNEMKCNDCDEQATANVDELSFCADCAEEYESEE